MGDLDQALHLWKYRGGFETVDNAKKFFAQDKVSIIHKQQTKYAYGYPRGIGKDYQAWTGHR